MAEPVIEKYQYKNQSSDRMKAEQTLCVFFGGGTFSQQEQKNDLLFFRWRSEKEHEYTFYTDVATFIEVACQKTS